MAERYGKVPKKFTKAWWEYFWDYYKVQTIIVLAIIAAIGITVYQKTTATKYDFNITYTGDLYFSEEDTENIQSQLTDIVPDMDNNNKTDIFFQQLVFSENNEINAEFNSAMISKLQLEFVTEDTMLFIFEEDKAHYLFDYDIMEGAFEPVETWAEKEFDDSMLYNKDGIAYAVKLSESGIFKELSVPSDSLYVAVRSYHGKDEKVTMRAENAKKVANELIKG